MDDSLLGGERPGRRERSAADAVVRAAIENVRDNLAALPASEVVQLALWPQTLAAWARERHEDESQLSNLFRRYRVYTRLRGELALRLDVPVAALAHLVEARPAHPRPFRRASEAPQRVIEHGDALDGAPAWPAAPPYPPVRDGSNPIEREALRRVEADCAAMPASRIVGLALWPETLTSWATASAQCAPGQLMTALSGLRRAPRAEIALARRLHVSVRALDDFITAVKAESVWRRPPEPADARPSAAVPSPEPRGRERRTARPLSPAPDPRQRELEL